MDAEQLAHEQPPDGLLHGGFRETGRFRHLLMARLYHRPAQFLALGPEVQVDEKGRRHAVVPGEVAQQDVGDVEIERYSFIHYSYIHYSAKYSIDRAPRFGYLHCMIKGVKFISVPVTDQDRALSFYTEKLGFRVMTDQPFDGKQRWIELSIPGADTAVVLFTPKEHESHVGTFSHASFYCDDAQKTYDELTAKGVEFAGPPKKEPWGTFLMLKDPDGNQFVVSAR